MGLAFLEDQKPVAVWLFEEVQGFVALFEGGAGDVGEGVGTAEFDEKDLAGGERVQRQAGAHESHWAGLGRYINGFVVSRQCYSHDAVSL